MVTINQERRRIVDIAIYLLIVGALIVLVYFVSVSDLFSVTVGQEESKDHVENVRLRVIAPHWNIEYSVVMTENVTVADFLFECADHYGFTVQKKYWKGYRSFLIEAINDIENGEDNRYWQYYVNGRFVDVGCSNYFLDDTDVVEWRFEQPNWMK